MRRVRLLGVGCGMGIYLEELFGQAGRVAIVTGGTGTLGGAMASGLASVGARVAVLGRNRDRAEHVAKQVGEAGGTAMPLSASVLDRAALEAVRDEVLATWGRIDILVNAAGGNVAAATVTAERSFFDVSPDALEEVVDLNLLGTLLPCQVFGRVMAEAGSGSIVNISSMAAQRALTRVGGYGAAKGAIEAFTRWLSVELARVHGERLRVNAIAPGFFIAEQNRRLMLNEDGSPTPRGKSVLDHTPAGRFGLPDDLVGTLLWLCSPGAAFVNGVVVNVDGGFGAFSGV